MNIKGEMAKKNISIDSISECLKIHRNSASNKINGKTKFTIEEAVKVRDEFFPDMDLKYLFGK